jgi:magnesium-transporting ATPase (P-type)|tara:strand:+ start:531 stop:1934 length:1404 start_codon:yes stop_codon:yes gene_type:complete
MHRCGQQRAARGDADGVGAHRTPVTDMASLTVKASLKSLVSFARGTSLVGETRLVHITTDHSVNKLFGHKGNGISTGKYNLVTFFPKGLYEQFRRVANLYFLSVAIISLFEAISPIKPYTIWAPLCLVVGLSMTKEAVEDYGRHKQDHEQNTSLTEKFDGTSMTQCEWRDIRAGDVVRVVRDQAFPCDLILLASPLDDAVCYVETKNLDGETNLKLKRGVEGCGVVGERGTKGLAFLKIFAGVVGNEANAAGTDAATIQSVVDAKADQVAPVIEPESRGIRRFTRLLSTRRAKKEDPPDPAGARVECEHPNNSLYTFTGNLDVPKGAYDGPLTEDDVHLFPDSKKKLSLVPYNVLLRGYGPFPITTHRLPECPYETDTFSFYRIRSSLRNTEWVLGVAIYTGHDTKVMMNSSAAPSKRSQIEYGMDRVVLMMLLLLLTMVRAFGLSQIQTPTFDALYGVQAARLTTT